jgi:hypothetical protein
LALGHLYKLAADPTEQGCDYRRGRARTARAEQIAALPDSAKRCFLPEWPEQMFQLGFTFKVPDPSQGLQRVEWKGTSQRLAQCWQLSKAGKTAICTPARSMRRHR